nr:MAG TPA_asm: hypothetical protein [Caudoviricetes sp.]
MKLKTTINSLCSLYFSFEEVVSYPIIQKL